MTLLRIESKAEHRMRAIRRFELRNLFGREL